MAERSRHGGGRAAGPKNDHMYFFVPDEKVDIACLAAYLKQFVDASVTIKPSRHPRVSHMHDTGELQGTDVVNRNPIA